MIRENEQRQMVAYLGGLDLTPVPSPNGEGCLLEMVNVLRELQSATREELSALLPSAEGAAIGGVVQRK